MDDTVNEPDETFRGVITPVSGDVEIGVGDALVTIIAANGMANFAGDLDLSYNTHVLYNYIVTMC